MFTLLLVADDWQKYCAVMVEKLSLQEVNVGWGSGPRDYPCLVTSYYPGPLPGQSARIVSCYMYVNDAKTLLHAAGLRSIPSHPEAGAAPQGPPQEKHNQWVAAHLLTIAHFLVATGICKEGQFEEVLLEKIEQVNQWHGEDKAALREKLAKHQLAVLESLDPPG